MKTSHDVDLAAAAFEPLVEAAGDNPAALLTLAEVARNTGRPHRAAALAERARQLLPDDPETDVMARDIIARTVPDFHMPMMHDGPRNDAFAAAIARQVRPGMRVLDVGSGSGLLAMMAARAGAEHVWSCEEQPAVAAVAREIIARNGFADRITIIDKHSGDVDADKDLGGPVDLVVSEIIGSDVVRERVLPSISDVVRRLLKPGARLIPQRAEIRAALAWFDGLDRRRIGSIQDFDLSPFNRLIRPDFHVPTNSRALDLRGPGETLFAFDFALADHGADRIETALTSNGRPANGVAQWLYLELDEHGIYENRPDEDMASSWDTHFHPLPGPVTPASGHRMGFGASYRGQRLRLWPLEHGAAA
jgi:type II protein arginine methyltransferase